MFAPADPTALAEFQIDPMRNPLFQILQPVTGTTSWVEVGYVWTFGGSRTNSIENWYLYATVPARIAPAATRGDGPDGSDDGSNDNEGSDDAHDQGHGGGHHGGGGPSASIPGVAATPQAPYSWPGYDAGGRIQGADLRLVPAPAPAGQSPETMKAYLERASGVTITYIRGTMLSGG